MYSLVDSAWPLEQKVRPLTDREFANISRLAYEKFGLELKGEKRELVSARLGKKVRRMGCRSFQEYYQRVLDDRTGEALVELIDALTTNFTGFMREPSHFEFLSNEVLPGWQGRDLVRIWSTACSTGEEPYTLAFSLLEALGSARRPRLEILATDISSRALEEASCGIPGGSPGKAPKGLAARLLSQRPGEKGRIVPRKA